MFAGGKKQAITPRYGLKWLKNNDRNKNAYKYRLQERLFIKDKKL